jgi:hypothetical protein
MHRTLSMTNLLQADQLLQASLLTKRRLAVCSRTAATTPCIACICIFALNSQIRPGLVQLFQATKSADTNTNKPMPVATNTLLHLLPQHLIAALPLPNISTQTPAKLETKPQTGQDPQCCTSPYPNVLFCILIGPHVSYWFRSCLFSSNAPFTARAHFPFRTAAAAWIGRSDAAHPSPQT